MLYTQYDKYNISLMKTVRIAGPVVELNNLLVSLRRNAFQQTKRG